MTFIMYFKFFYYFLLDRNVLFFPLDWEEAFIASGEPSEIYISQTKYHEWPRNS